MCQNKYKLSGGLGWLVEQSSIRSDREAQLDPVVVDDHRLVLSGFDSAEGLFALK